MLAPIIKLIIRLDKTFVHSDLSVIRQYLMDNALSIKDFQRKFDENMTDIHFENEDDEARFDSLYEQESEKYFKIYPQIFYNSIIISLYSYLEYKMKKLNEDLNKHDRINRITKVKKNSNESKINCYKRFLTENYNIDFSNIDEDWSQIELFAKLRNVIVHDNSFLKLNKHELVNFLKKFNSIEINDETGYLVIRNEESILDFCKRIENCLQKIYESIENKIYSA